ncbi:bifunctional GNAT family N-acetyltransferase/acetate--CoA ligase family protein [Arthrobacter sp. UM1]|uniref:bifunctional acetate--CoA ligase family protein/GNAT family N-acetyltransferase n=1 Tax=Arthrobacter sp. UM1 TaxID=2766776 RepID=UPI001CF67F44|nr:bifunctional GNAT family N-acetyltransferase/acetate--CoA ligase family protein [Arthrobacter sp. UM1]MCB4207662.1 GNAT family N-acetyltransferase [Arthrobacter sp. UM1]
MAKRPARADYPAHWEADVVLRDGSTAHLRPITPADSDLLQQFHQGQSANSIYLRFFTYKAKLSSKELARFTQVDYTDRVAFVLTRGERIVGIGRYDRLPHDESSAEVAFNIADSFQGKGLGSILLEHLAAAARERGVKRFVAEILPENRKMMTVFIEAGYEVSRKFDDGVIALEFDVASTARSLEVMASREQRAESMSVADILTPSSVAVIGASRKWGSIGQRVLEGILESGFSGPVYAVNPETLEVGGRLTYAAVGEIPDDVDLAVIAVPRSSLKSVVEQCAVKGVKSAVILTDSALGDDAAHRSTIRSIVATARSYGMRIVGPASLGVINTDPEHPLNASVAESLPKEGPVALFAQSAAIGVMLFAEMGHRNVGMSAFFSAGHRADLSGNDAMQHFESDHRSRAVGLFLESIGNPRKFARISRRLSQTKPVVVAKSHVMGFRLPDGHSFGQTQAPSRAFDAMLRQSGVIRVRSNEELVRVMSFLATQPVPRGRRVAVLTNSHPLARVVADSAGVVGLEVAEQITDVSFSRGQSRVLPELRRRLVEAMADVDAVIVALLPVVGIETAQLAQAVHDAGAEAKTPVVVSFAGIVDPSIRTEGVVDVTPPPAVEEAPDAPDADLLPVQHGLPSYASPASAVRVLALAADYGMWRSSDRGEFVDPEGTSPERAERALASALARQQNGDLVQLTAAETAEVLEAYGIRPLTAHPFDTTAEALATAAEIGYPVALKPLDEDLRHRLDLGSVVLNIQSDESLRLAIGQTRTVLRRFLPDEAEATLEIQPMADPGQACLLRAVEDPLLGPVVSFALAGDSAELLDDWAYAATPMTGVDVHDLVRRPRAAAKLSRDPRLGRSDLEALEDLVARVAHLKDRHPEMARLEINPVLVHSEGLTVLEARVWAANPQRRRDSARRALWDA